MFRTLWIGSNSTTSSCLAEIFGINIKVQFGEEHKFTENYLDKNKASEPREGKSACFVLHALHHHL